MSPQMDFLKNLIASTRNGNEGADKLLREVCKLAVESAPTHDLVTLAECLYHVGIEATRTEARRN